MDGPSPGRWATCGEPVSRAHLLMRWQAPHQLSNQLELITTLTTVYVHYWKAAAAEKGLVVRLDLGLPFSDIHPECASAA